MISKHTDLSHPMTVLVNSYPLQSMVGLFFIIFPFEKSTDITSISEPTLKIITLFKRFYLGIHI